MHGFRCIWANGIGPGSKFVSSAVQIPPVVLRHMLRLHHRVALGLVQPDMGSDPRLLVKHLYNLTGQTDVYLLANQVVRDGILVDTSETR